MSPVLSHHPPSSGDDCGLLAALHAAHLLPPGGELPPLHELLWRAGAGHSPSRPATLLAGFSCGVCVDLETFLPLLAHTVVLPRGLRNVFKCPHRCRRFCKKM